MSESKKRIAIISGVILYIVILIVLGVFSFVTKSFLVRAILHFSMRILFIPFIFKILKTSFKVLSANKPLVICGVVISLDLVILDLVRYVLSEGTSTFLYFPACIPICLMIIMHYSFKKYDKKDKRIIYIVGIPLLILSMYFEILSFMQI